MIDNTQIKLLINLKPGAQLVQYEKEIFRNSELLIVYATSLSCNPTMEKYIKRQYWMGFPKVVLSSDDINYIIYMYATVVLKDRWLVAERVIQYVKWRWLSYKEYHGMPLQLAHSFNKPVVSKKSQWVRNKNTHGKMK